VAWPILGAILNTFVSGLVGFTIGKKIWLTVGLKQSPRKSPGDSSFRLNFALSQWCRVPSAHRSIVIVTEEWKSGGSAIELRGQQLFYNRKPVG